MHWNVGSHNPIGIIDTNKQQITKHSEVCYENGEYKICGGQEKGVTDYP